MPSKEEIIAKLKGREGKGKSHIKGVISEDIHILKAKLMIPCQGISLNVFTNRSKFRLYLIYLVQHPRFEMLILFLIFI